MTWAEMDARPKRRAEALTEADISRLPGVYAFYRGGARIYVGKASSLRSRLWKNHLRTGRSMSNSALRRNVAERLGIAAANDIKERRYRITNKDALRVFGWIRECDVAWIECANDEEGKSLEKKLKVEHKPPLTKR